MAKGRLFNLIKSFIYVFASNIMSMMVNIILVLVIPRLVDTETYGYYQLYNFYILYVGILQFGWCEGIYLRIGGMHYSDLDKSLYSTQFRILGLTEIVICTIVFLFSYRFVEDKSKQFIIGAVCAATVGLCLRWFITYIFQATGRVKEYAIIMVSEKVLLLFLTALLMVVDYRGYKLIIVADMFSKYVSLVIGICYCKDIVFSKMSFINKAMYEAKCNISAGIKLLLVSMSTAIITGIFRTGIESHWDISTFGKISLTYSFSNLVVLAIYAVGVAIYPLLRRTNQANLTEIYEIMRTILMSIVLGALIFYYPAQKILTLWLPKYAESLRYAAILLPICVYESKVSILINTYFNTLRLERLQMKCNLTAIALSLLLTGVSIYVFDSVTAATLSMLIVLVFRCVICEIVLSTKISIKVVKDIIIELVMTLAFIICNWYLGFIGMLMYATCYIMYLIIKRKDIFESLSFIKSMK